VPTRRISDLVTPVETTGLSTRAASLGSPRKTCLLINCGPKEVLDVLERTGKFYV
jgi:hypothetical protein